MSQIVNQTTGQSATGRVFVKAFADYLMMAWCGPDDSLSINIGQCASGQTDFAVTQLAGLSGYSSSAASEDSALAEEALMNGPVLAIGPNQSMGYLVYVNAAAQIVTVRLTLAPTTDNPYNWTMMGKPVTVSESAAAGAPAAALGIQNGQLVLNILWQDSNAASMVLCQMQVGNESSTVNFQALGVSCIGAPWLTGSGAASFLAWTGLDKQVNLAIDPVGGVTFAFGQAITLPSIMAIAGPAYVPLNQTQGYVVWLAEGGDGEVSYAQIGRAPLGGWVVNGVAGCSGTTDGILAAAAPPFARYLPIAGDETPALLFVWPTPPAKGEQPAQYWEIIFNQVAIGTSPILVTQEEAIA